MISVKIGLFSFSMPHFIEHDCQAEQGKSCAKRLRFERNRQAPNDFLHMAEKEGCGLAWRGHCPGPVRNEVIVREQVKLLLSPSQDSEASEAILILLSLLQLNSHS